MSGDSPGSGAMAGPGNAEDEHAELERLRAEVRALRAQQADGNGTPPVADAGRDRVAAAGGLRSRRW